MFKKLTFLFKHIIRQKRPFDLYQNIKHPVEILKRNAQDPYEEKGL